MPAERIPTPAPLPIARPHRVVDVDAIDDVAGYVKVNGREVAVHHLDALAYGAIVALERDAGAVDINTLYDAVARACPELSRDEVDRLSTKKIGAILAVADRGIKDVEASIESAAGADPNGMGPTEETPIASPSASSLAIP